MVCTRSRKKVMPKHRSAVNNNSTVKNICSNLRPSLKRSTKIKSYTKMNETLEMNSRDLYKSNKEALTMPIHTGIAGTSNCFPKLVKLRVGDKKFYTTLSTLRKGDTLLSTMFSNEIVGEKDDEGFVFFDRSDKHFSKILDYLRNGMLPALKDETEAKELELEAEYYGIDVLKEHCENFKRTVMVSLVYWNDLYWYMRDTKDPEYVKKRKKNKKDRYNNDTDDEDIDEEDSDGEDSDDDSFVSDGNTDDSKQDDYGGEDYYWPYYQDENHFGHHNDEFSWEVDYPLNNPIQIPLMPDGTISFRQLLLTLGIEKKYFVKILARYWTNDKKEYSAPVYHDFSRREGEDGWVYPGRWHSERGEGKPCRLPMEIKDDKVYPPKYGWNKLPDWAYDGPHFFVICRNYSKTVPVCLVTYADYHTYTDGKYNKRLCEFEEGTYESELKLSNPHHILLRPNGTLSLRKVLSTFGIDCKDAMGIENTTFEEISVRYWSRHTGKTVERNLDIKDDKIYPPKHGWFERPKWAYDGPEYYVLANKSNN